MSAKTSELIETGPANPAPIEFTSFSQPVHFDAELSDSGAPFWQVVAYCPKFGDDLVVAKFDYDGSSPDAEHYKAQAHAMAVLLVEAGNRIEQ